MFKKEKTDGSHKAYHITRGIHLYNISKKGLIPKQGYRSAMLHESKLAVYYVPKLEILMFRNNFKDTGFVILSFDTSKFKAKDLGQRKSQMGDERWTTNKIPPEQLSLVQIKDAKTGEVVPFDELPIEFAQWDYLNAEKLAEANLLISEQKICMLDIQKESMSERYKNAMLAKIDSYISKRHEHSAQNRFGFRENEDGVAIIGILADYGYLDEKSITPIEQEAILKSISSIKDGQDAASIMASIKTTVQSLRAEKTK